MKKILILLALVPAFAFAQLDLTSNTGVTKNLHVGKTSTADSLYVLGTVDISDCDSIQIVASTTDSARIALLPQIVTANKTTDTVSVPGHPISIQTYNQVTAAAIIVWEWWLIKAKLLPYAVGAKSLKLSYMLFLTGTETYSGASADRVTWYVKKFKSR